MVGNQNNKCKICLMPFNHLNAFKDFNQSTMPLVDHDHETGKVRGLLCNGCNIAIGYAKDSPETLRRMAAYIEGH